LWHQLLGEIPSDQQVDLWSALHTPEVIRRGILKTAQKNMSFGSTMSADHKLRFASKVMITATAQKIEHTANRDKVRREFEAQ
jgi:hypothetical protein